jgi:hypothetical protein
LALDAASAWKGIAKLLLTCDLWTGSGYKRFHDVVVYRDSNDFKHTKSGRANAVLDRAEQLTRYLSAQLNVTRASLCEDIGTYWRLVETRSKQPNNLVGNAFRSLVVHILERFGNRAVEYAEEVSAISEFPGFPFQTRSKKPKLDIVARINSRTVAIISARWRFRHDRVDVVDEAISYASAATRLYPNCQLYVAVGEFTPNRLDKILSNCRPQMANAAISACVHFAPKLISEGMGENGRLANLKGLDWLIQESFTWK